MGSPLALTSDLLEKAIAAIKRKKKTVKRLSEAVELVNIKPRLVQANLYPTKIKTIDNLQFLDRISLPA